MSAHQPIITEAPEARGTPYPCCDHCSTDEDMLGPGACPYAPHLEPCQHNYCGGSMAVG